MGHTLMTANGTYPDDCPSRSMTYTGFHPESDSLQSLLKDGNSPALIPRCQPIKGYTLMVVRADPQLIQVFTLTATLWGVSRKMEAHPRRSLRTSLWNKPRWIPERIHYLYGPNPEAYKIAHAATSRECPERRKFTYINHAKLAYNRNYHDVPRAMQQSTLGQHP